MCLNYGGTTDIFVMKAQVLITSSQDHIVGVNLVTTYSRKFNFLYLLFIYFYYQLPNQLLKYLNVTLRHSVEVICQRAHYLYVITFYSFALTLKCKECSLIFHLHFSHKFYLYSKVIPTVVITIAWFGADIISMTGNDK